MIVFIEGPRHSGKTHLLEKFFEQNQDPNIVYYKFKFAKYIDELGMRDQESGPGVHYFSIANILTILELNLTLLKDKVIVFDRAIFSAYVWSIYRDRLDRERLMQEFSKILDSDLYQDCGLIYLTRGVELDPEKREKDYFGNFEDYDAEKKLFDLAINSNINSIVNLERRNLYSRFENDFDEASVEGFKEILLDLVGINKGLSSNK
jgi:hypothetical protein